MGNRNHSFHKLVELLLSGAKVSTLDALILVWSFEFDV